MTYFDHSATTPVAEEVFESMKPYLSTCFYNASSLYSGGKEAAAAIEKARQSVADLINADSCEVVFTSGGTEADNTAIISTAINEKEKGRNKIVVSSIEHHAVLDSCAYLNKLGFEIEYLPVDRYGRVDIEDIKKAVDDKTALLSVMYVNNEIGSIQNVESACAIAHGKGALFHTDCVQALTNTKVDFHAMDADFMSISSHKIYGPKGCGALIIKKGTDFHPFMHGGQQESGMRGGTENVACIAGFGKAAELIKESLSTDVESMLHHKKALIELLDADDTLINSPLDISSPSILNVAFKDVEAEGMLFFLGRDGISVSMGSACNSKSVEPSHVINAIKLPEEYRRGCIRISFGHGQSDEDINLLAKKLIKYKNQLKY